MRVWVNGEERDVDEGITLKALLAELGLGEAAVAVAVGHEVVTRADHADHQLNAGDRVEIIRAVGGG